jgi:hypothetical protein
VISAEERTVREARLRDGVLGVADDLERFASERAGFVDGSPIPTKIDRSENEAPGSSTEQGQMERTEIATPPTGGPRSQPIQSVKPIVFVSYAHTDEPDRPAEGETKWLSFVMSYLKPAIKRGAVDVWIDQLMRGGDDWDSEIEHKLPACDIFVILVSAYSMSSDYVVDKEIAIIRERQRDGEDVHFYPLLLTPTPKIGLDVVSDRNLRPRDAKPFSDYSPSDRLRQMAIAADEIAAIAKAITARKDIQFKPN